MTISIKPEVADPFGAPGSGAENKNNQLQKVAAEQNRPLLFLIVICCCICLLLFVYLIYFAVSRFLEQQRLKKILKKRAKGISSMEDGEGEGLGPRDTNPYRVSRQTTHSDVIEEEDVVIDPVDESHWAALMQANAVDDTKCNVVVAPPAHFARATSIRFAPNDLQVFDCEDGADAATTPPEHVPGRPRPLRQVSICINKTTRTSLSEMAEEQRRKSSAATDSDNDNDNDNGIFQRKMTIATESAQHTDPNGSIGHSDASPPPLPPPPANASLCRRQSAVLMAQQLLDLQKRSSQATSTSPKSTHSPAVVSFDDWADDAESPTTRPRRGAPSLSPDQLQVRKEAVLNEPLFGAVVETPQAETTSPKPKSTSSARRFSGPKRRSSIVFTDVSFSPKTPK